MATDSINQKQGVINKCPSCGGPLKAFASVCDLCGHELAGIGANKTISDLVERFDAIEREVAGTGAKGNSLEKEVISRKARVIRDFPIPNAREDLRSLIYFIHPKIEESIKPDPNAEDWRVKFREVLNLAKNAYKSDAKARAEFEEIERSLNVSLAGSLQTRAKRSPILAIVVVGVILLAIVGIVASQMDKWKLKKCEDQYAESAGKESSRLDGLLKQAEATIKAGKFSDSVVVLNQVHWDVQAECKQPESEQSKLQWEEKREEMLVLVQKLDAETSAQKKAETERVTEEKRAEQAKAETAQRVEEARIAAEKRAVEEARLAAERVVAAKQATSKRNAATSKEW